MIAALDIETIGNDASVCPVGGVEYVGKSWWSMPNTTLAMALASGNAAITERHIESINTILKGRTAVELDDEIAIEVLADRLRTKKRINW